MTSGSRNERTRTMRQGQKEAHTRHVAETATVSSGTHFLQDLLTIVKNATWDGTLVALGAGALAHWPSVTPALPSRT